MNKKSQEGGTNATQYDHIWLRFNQSKGHIRFLRAACKFMRLDNSIVSEMQEILVTHFSFPSKSLAAKTGA